mgnify:FL=1|tara:strand:- start:128 stop:538 length:411 start_codon:yes stop_codon:yes gene_type:complete
MVYQIEVSVNLNKVTNLTEIKNMILSKADECKLEDFYTIFEHIGKNRQIYRNHCVLVFLFTENDELLADFIRYVKNIKHVSIECVGLDKGKFELIYASKKYLNMMEKEFAEKYLITKRANKLYKQDSIIFKTILKK